MYQHWTNEIDRSQLVSHQISHPNGSKIHAEWAEEQTLHVAVAYSNPFRWKSRQALMNNFRRHMDTLSNIKLYVCELAYGNRPFEVTSSDCRTDIQLRTNHELFHKENIINVAVSRFDSNWIYGAYIDADFQFTRHDIALETIHQLQHYDWVQMFSHYADLNNNHKPFKTTPGFAFQYKHGFPAEGAYERKGTIAFGSPGGAWAFRRKSFNDVGGLLDVCILGSADSHMAKAMIADPSQHPTENESKGLNPEYIKYIKAWQERARRVINGNIGYVNSFAVHHWHGPKQKRGYGTRWKILRDAKFDPLYDIHKDYQGIYQLTDQKPKLRDGIRSYFLSRNEDLIE